MTLLGKYLTGLIAVMSVLFLGFAIAVYATHVNWRKLVSNPNPGPGESRGLQQQLENQLNVNRQLKEQIDDLMASIALEQYARVQALAALETKLAQRTEELAQVQAALAAKDATATITASNLETAQSELASITAEVKALRDEVQAAQKDADQKYVDFIKLTDENSQLIAMKNRLEQRNAPLLQQVAALRDALTKAGVRIDIGEDGTVRTDVDRLPPDVKGQVIEVEKNLVEVSVGGDDGILVGHTLDVYREGTYLGKVIVLKTSQDRAVAEIIPDFSRGTIRKGDRVATKFS
jgi:hypothetical protein